MTTVGAPPLRVGIAGLGIAARQVLSAFDGPSVKLAAVADVRTAELDAARDRWGVQTFERVADMCASPDVDAVWVSTPNTLHAEHVIAAANAGKHVICEKPMAVTLEQCDRMIEAVERNGVKFVQGHSKIYDAPIRLMRKLIEAGEIGDVIRVESANFNDWLLRPRLATEVDSAQGGGVVYRQGPHQVDIVRWLGVGMVRSVRARVGRHEPSLRTEGDFAAFLDFADGAAGLLSFNGYGYFSSTDLTWDIGEGGQLAPAPTGPRSRPAGPISAEAKYSLPAYAGGDRPSAAGRRQPFFGLTVVSGTRGVLRQSPDGVYLQTAQGRREIACEDGRGRGSELAELAAAIRDDREPFPGARWGKATLEVCLAMLESSRGRGEVMLGCQVVAPSLAR